MSRLPIPHIINQIKTKLGFDRTLTASGEDVVDAVNKQSQQIGTLALRGSVTASSTYTNGTNITCTGLTANHHVDHWGLYSDQACTTPISITNPPADITITEKANAYSMVIENKTSDFYIRPTFVLPQNLS